MTTSTSSARRGDVAYVGQLSNTSFLAIANINLSGGDSSNYNDSAVYTLCKGSGSSTVVLSRGYLGSGLSGIENELYQPLYLQWNSDNSSIAINDITGIRLGYMSINDNNYIVISQEPLPLVLTTTDPSGYGTGILAGCRYTLSTPTFASNDIRINVNHGIQISSGPYMGLYTNNRSTSSGAMDVISWSFIPINPVYLTPDTVQSIPNNINPSLAISQCIYLQDVSGYGTSSICNNWQGGVGFTTEADVQSIIYYYSQDGTCGDDYTFTNFLGESSIVSTSNGSCVTNNCMYSVDDNLFSCRADDNGGGSDRDGLLTKWWFWGLLILVIIIAIIIIVVIAVAASKKSKSVEPIVQ